MVKIEHAEQLFPVMCALRKFWPNGAPVEASEAAYKFAQEYRDKYYDYTKDFSNDIWSILHRDVINELADNMQMALTLCTMWRK